MSDIHSFVSFVTEGGCVRKTLVSCQISSGIGIHVHGLNERVIRDVLLRTLTALTSKGFSVPGKKVVITVQSQGRVDGPANQLDLPVALSLLSASGQMVTRTPMACCGELGLDGSVRSVGYINEFASLCRENGIRDILIPCCDISGVSCCDISEEIHCDDISLHGAATLEDAVNIISASDGC